MELTFIQKDQVLTTSLKVAEVFKKRHDTVLRAIENAIASVRNFAAAEKAFIKSTYIDSQGKNRPMYYLNRDGFNGNKSREVFLRNLRTPILTDAKLKLRKLSHCA